MGFGRIQFGGLASGLDTNAIISAILAVEQRPIQQLEDRKSIEKNRISLFGTLEGLVKTLQEKAEQLTKKSFLAYEIDVADEGVISVVQQGTSATPGGHTVDVQSLARADRYSFDTAVTDPASDTVGAGSLSFDYDGQSFAVTIDAADSLNDVAAAINTAADGSVTASVINVATQASPVYKLVLAADESGLDFTIDNLSTSSAGLTAQTQVTTASNAVVLVDGLRVERSTNLFEGVLPGISFTVHQELAQTSFGIEADPEGTQENVQEFIDAYNEVMSFIEKQSSFSEEEGASSDLFGDRALTTIRSTLRSALFDVDLATVQNDTKGYSTLGLVGIDIEANGRLSIDDDEFAEKLIGDLGAMQALFTDATDGVLVRLDAAIDELLKGPVDENGDPITIGNDPIDGLFDRRRDTLNRVIKRMDGDIARLELRLETLEATLVQQFANLESIVGGLNAQSSFLASGLAFPTAN